MKTMLRRMLVRLLVLTGLKPRAARSVLDDLATARARLALALGASVVAPVLELAFISLLYTMVEPAQKEAALQLVRSIGLDTVVQRVGGEANYPILAGALSFGLLGAMVGAKYLFGYQHAYFLLLSFVTQSRRVIAAYLHASPACAMTLDRGRVANAAVTEASHYGRVVFALLDMVSNVVAAVLFIAAGVVMAPVLLFLVVLVGVLTVCLTRRGFLRQRAIGERRVDVQSGLTGSIWELLEAYRTIKVEAAEHRILRRFKRELREKQTWRVDKARAELEVKLGAEGIIYLSLLGMLLVATTVVQLDVALLLMFLVLMSRLQKYVGLIQQAWVQVQHALPSLAVMSDIVDMCQASASVPPQQASLEAPPATIRLTFDRVDFRYKDEQRVLEDVSLQVEPGERVLIQGPSGQGKSTLLYLACGLLRPTAGRVLVDGDPIDDELFYRLRPALTYVAPNTYLFRGSIRENLCLGTDHEEAVLLAALERARLGELVRRMPEGLDGDIGENGRDLSLGERQRVMLARLFLKRPKLILLDEATTNLDLENERMILADLFANVPPDTVILMVTHRAPVGVTFSKIFELDGGRLRPRTVAVSA